MWWQSIRLPGEQRLLKLSKSRESRRVRFDKEPAESNAMKPTLTSTLAIIAILLAAPAAFAWWADGHMLIAAIAYHDLTAPEQARVDAILSHHPSNSVWSAGGASHLEVFMRATTWADDIRNYNDESTHPYWHFIDYKLKPQQYLMRPDLQPTNNAVLGIRKLTDWLDEPHLSAPVQDKHLAFLVHF